LLDNPATDSMTPLFCHAVIPNAVCPPTNIWISLSPFAVFELNTLNPLRFTSFPLTSNIAVGEVVPIPKRLFVLFQNRLESPVIVPLPFQKVTWPVVPVPVTGLVKTAWYWGIFKVPAE